MSVKYFPLYLLLISALVLSPCYGADTTAPRPVPAKWRIVPITLGPNSIQMAAVTALDQAGSVPIQYLFECSNIPSASSTWQTDTNYIATGLTESTVYTFRVRARDSALNMTSWALARSATTDAVTTPPVLRLDLNHTINNDEPNTQAGFMPLSIATSGSEVNGIIIDLSGTINSARRDDPCGGWARYAGTPLLPGDPCYYSPRAGERIYRDFVYGVNPSGVTITLWGLGTNRDCNITIWSWDSQVTDVNRVAQWYANGTHLFDADFIGGVINQPLPDNYSSSSSNDFWKWAFSARATSDDFGRIILTSERGPSSPENQPFAFVNAIQVEPNASIAFAETPYAQRPVPFNGAEDAPIDAVLSWLQGGLAETHDIYFGTNETAVTDANRSNTLGVLVSQGQESNTYDPYGAAGLLKLNTTYYWRVDEVNAAPDYTIFKSETWSFRTLPDFVVEDFDSYEDNSALRNVWQNSGTSAEVSVETAIVRNGNSMRYLYKNNLPPYYSEVCADIADLGMDDPDWLGTGAKALVVRFHVEPNNPFSEQLYVKLTDGDSPPHTATVIYSNMNTVWLKQWNEWSISLTEFADANLANVAKITIGFGDGNPGDADTVYFEDIMLDSIEAEELPEIRGEANVNIVYQQLEGFGGSACYESGTLANYSSREAVYDLLFRDLGLDVLRIKNTYEINYYEINATGQIVAAARQATRNPNLKLLLVPWSPAAYLKSSGDLGTLNSTLAGGPSNYVYADYATWWLNSLTGLYGWNSVGIYPDYISIQNEPDWGQQDQVCRFNPVEDANYAGYDQAFEAVYNRLNGSVSPMPKMLAPEAMGFGSSRAYINALVNRGQIDHVYGFSHHLYSDGSYYSPDGMIQGMLNYNALYGYKPLFQTEYSADAVPSFGDAVLLAQHIYNCLVYEGVTSYYHWSLFRGWGEGGMINITNPSTYIVRDLYWFFKHYAYFTDPGWYMVDVFLEGTGSDDLRITAFKSPENDQLTIVMLNTSAAGADLMFTLKGFIPSSSEIYRSSETEHWLYLGPYSPGLTLPAYSITTIHLTGTTSPDCDAILDAGYGLTSDISGDCYVNYEDLKIIADNWLHTDCAEEENCEGADFTPTDGNVDLFDFARFAEQWLLCNDPEDTGCMENW
ncbi:MAG: hypothetical protein PHQ35_04365 [Phycisphaerae bacterium]|nr:hypothetical protein [Phycisphaerae bacterium]MDD5380247.1 hypothetical protein [Phycisphaerae bacterium]